MCVKNDRAVKMNFGERYYKTQRRINIFHAPFDIGYFLPLLYIYINTLIYNTLIYNIYKIPLFYIYIKFMSVKA